MLIKEKKSLPFEEKFYKSYGNGSLEQYIIYIIFYKYFRAFFVIAEKTKYRGFYFTQIVHGLKEIMKSYLTAMNTIRVTYGEYVKKLDQE